MIFTPRQSFLEKLYRSRFASAGNQSFQGSGYCNMGYWSGTTAVGKHNDHLVDRLLNFLPKTEGNVLDVACGQGGTTKRLTAFFAPSNITAINLFEDQLRAAREIAPGCKFLQMDAAKLTFDDESFDVIICVEAAFHFETREDFFKESWRVLRPGGFLVLADILVTGPCQEIPEENVVSRAEYEEAIKRVGFLSPEIVSARNQTWESFLHRHFWHLLKMKGWKTAITWWWSLRDWDKRIVDYLLVSAQKPSQQC